MSWLYSRALVEEFSAATCSGGAQSALSSGSHTPQAFLPSDKMTAFSRPSRFGMTFKPLTEDLGAELLTWFLAASRARTSALPVRVQASAVSDQECGPTWRASLARFDPDSSSWKTAQLCLLGDSELSSVTWPRSGMTVAGQCWELPMSEPRTSATGSGLWRTPSACVVDAKSTVTKLLGRTPKDPQVGLADQVMAAERGMWPTPTVCGNYNRKGASKNSGDGLATAVAKWPTPTAVTSSGGAALCKWGGSGSREILKKIVTPEELNGALNPTWVEWLMGWPLGWTDLEPLATDKYLCAPLRHGAC